MSARAEDRFALADLAALYMRALDRLDEALLAAQFWPDARCEYGIFSGGPAD
ncbi:MAG: nuclear transport factor 2 family protein, partial [Erythrobacter cryptus]